MFYDSLIAICSPLADKSTPRYRRTRPKQLIQFSDSVDDDHLGGQL